MSERPPDDDVRLWQLVHYFHDCLAAQTDWAHTINIFAQRDLTTLPLSSSEQHQLGADGELSLSDPHAIELAKRVSVSGDQMSLVLGALFLVGTAPAKDDQNGKQFCAPLLEVPLSLHDDSGSVLIKPEESAFIVNYSLVGELLSGEQDDLQDRMSELSEVVPDFPIDAEEFQDFWNRFRLIAPELAISQQLPERRKSKNSKQRLLPIDNASTAESWDADQLEMIDFYSPRIPSESNYRLLPATAIIFGPKAGRSLSALAELRAMTDMPLSRTAFGSVFDPATPTRTPIDDPSHDGPEDVYPLPLSPAQESIIKSARREPLTVVTGPPGTGKSYTITAIVLDAIRRGESVLVASQMDKAVEVVADHVEETAGSLSIARSGGRAAQRQLAKKVSDLTGPRSDINAVPEATIKESQENHFALMRQLQELESGFGQVLEREQHWSRLREEVELAGSVLPRPPAKISDAAIRKAAAEMERIRVVEERPSVIRRWLNRWRVARVRRQLQIPKQEEISLQDLRALIAYHSMTLQMHDIERSFRSVMPADQAWNALKRVERELRSSSIEQLNLHRSKRLRRLLSDSSDRAALRDLAALLRRRKEDLKIQLQQSLTAELLLDAFPAWACTSRTLCEILPATPGLFDLVVIDEASQCDLALASVALMRAKRAVVVGDPNQLRHVCFLSRAREQASFVRNKLSEKMQLRFQYRRSLFDVASDSVETRNFFFLNEHFRSHPQIIDFSNRQFYDGSLSIMTERPSTGLQKAIRIEHVDGCRVLESSVNPTELARVISIIDEQVAANDNRSIGIISPFRDQADAIKEQLVRHLSAESLRKHDLVVGTAHSLQGDEKDIVILSTSIDGDSHPASLRFLESPNLFNVAVTRAREQLIIVTSVSAEQLPVGMLREFLVHAESNWQNGQKSNVTECELEQEIIHQLDAEGIPCLAGYQAAGTRIDIVAVGERRSVAILCDRPKRTDWEQVLETQRRLSRASWTTVRLSRRLVEQHWDVCINTIRKQLG